MNRLVETDVVGGYKASLMAIVSAERQARSIPDNKYVEIAHCDGGYLRVNLHLRHNPPIVFEVSKVAFGLALATLWGAKNGKICSSDPIGRVEIHSLSGGISNLPYGNGLVDRELNSFLNYMNRSITEFGNNVTGYWQTLDTRSMQMLLTFKGRVDDYEWTMYTLRGRKAER